MLNQILTSEQNMKNQNIDSEPYRKTPEEIVEEDWFARVERICNLPDPREIAARRWEAELSL